MITVDEAKELVQQLNRYSDAYYNRQESLISDEEYDKLYDQLAEFEKTTGIQFANSPLHSVGYQVKSKLDKVKHSHPMLSLNKTKEVSDLVSFMNNRNCVLSLKMDGLTVLLTYDNGSLVKAETRGDGETGEDVTHNAKVFKNIPLTINYKGKIEIEGEVIITYDDFNTINEGLTEDEQYKNPRNLASGSVRQLDSKVAAQRHLKFVAWKVPMLSEEVEWYDEESEETLITKTYSSYVNKLKYVRELGFDIVPYTTHTSPTGHTPNAVNQAIDALKMIAKEFSYPIDGLVLTYNDTMYAESLGSTDHHPKHSIAFKFYDEVEETELINIEWQVGKSGQITPVAVFKPVEIDGTIIEKASLHNLSILDGLMLDCGDKITVYKANQIIPQIKENLSLKEKTKLIAIGESVRWLGYPQYCPVCGSHTVVNDDGNAAFLYCTNRNCKGKAIARLSHFVSKSAINIDGLSESILEKLFDLGFITAGLWSIYDLVNEREELYKIDGFGKKSVDKLLANIEKSKTTTLERFINSLSIPSIGKVTSKNISKHFKGNFVEFDNAVRFGYDWTKIPDIGDAAAHNINYYFMDEGYFSEYEALVDQDDCILKFENPYQESSNTLNGMTFVITGSLDHYPNRSMLVNVIESNGGKVASSVSKKTTYLINNDNLSTSSKNKKAKSLGIEIITEEDFMKMIGV